MGMDAASDATAFFAPFFFCTGRSATMPLGASGAIVYVQERRRVGTCVGGARVTCARPGSMSVLFI